MQYLKVFKYLVQYFVFKYYLNTAKCEVFHKVFKYSGQSICPNTNGEELSTYGINGSIIRWIEAFLVDCVQGVVVEGFRSQEDKVLSAVPQGTVLGHLLFLLHINDLPSVVTSQTVRLFADDCLLYRPILSSADRVALQRDLDMQVVVA